MTICQRCAVCGRLRRSRAGFFGALWLCSEPCKTAFLAATAAQTETAFPRRAGQ